MTGWRVLDVQWKGVLLADLLDRAGVPARRRPRCSSPASTGPTPRASPWNRPVGRDVIVAYQLEGDDISDAHGGPVRLYVAPMYGYKSIKWLDGIELTSTGATRLLGGARLRRRRVDREIEWSRRPTRLTPPLLRFGPVERRLHWVNATLFFVLMLTGAILYVGPLSALVGRRELVKNIHV